jgi:hypothetical protein
MKIKHGITGNYYGFSELKSEIEELCEKIKKAKSSIYWNKKYNVWVIKVKQKSQKQLLKKIALVS